MPRPLIALACCLTILAVVICHPAITSAETEDNLFRKLKTDVFEERWADVLAGCDQLIATYPKSENTARTMYYRAKALGNLEGRGEEALDAYGEFIGKFPENAFLVEDAKINRMGLAKSLWLKGNKKHIRILMDSLTEEGFLRIYSAIQISHLGNRPARARALPVLQACAKNEKDAEVRNECTLGILRIDPSALPTAPRAAVPNTPAPPVPPGGEPKLIRVEVRDKATNKITVAVNLPIAFAEALIGSLSEFDQGMVLDELRKRKIDINNIWKSLRTLGKQTLVQIETEENHIKIWLE
jgi:hypothetical protein